LKKSSAQANQNTNSSPEMIREITAVYKTIGFFFLEIAHRAEIEPHSAICTAFFLSHEKYFSNPKQEFTK